MRAAGGAFFFSFFFSNAASSLRREIASLVFRVARFFHFSPTLTCAVFCTSPRLWMFPKNLLDLAFWMRLETACERKGEGERKEGKR